MPVPIGTTGTILLFFDVTGVLYRTWRIVHHAAGVVNHKCARYWVFSGVPPFRKRLKPLFRIRCSVDYVSHVSHTKTKRENHLSDRDSSELNQATHSQNHLTHQWILLAALSPPRASLPLMPTTGKSFRVHTSSFPPFKLLFAAYVPAASIPRSLLDYIIDFNE